MHKKKIFIRSTAIEKLMEGSPSGGGIAVQLYFWANTFRSEGWTVYSMSGEKTYEKEGVHFLKYHNWGKLDIIHEWLHTAWVYFRYRPDLVMERGAGRPLYPVTRLSKLFSIKTVLFGAIDSNFEPGKELLSGSERNRKFYQKGIPLVSYIVVQNDYQKQTLKDNYGREALVMQNIWRSVPVEGKAEPSDVVWVANFRPHKRPEWMFTAAQALPEAKFTMVGGPDSKAVEFYENIRQQANSIANMAFLGSRPFMETCDIISQSKVLVCSSKLEGFPNTFLQAWSYGLPVVSTVDPSGIIVKNNLGVVVETEEELTAAIKQLLEDEKEYAEKCESVKTFFEKNYLSSDNYTRLMEYINK